LAGFSLGASGDRFLGGYLRLAAAAGSPDSGLLRLESTG